MSVIQIVFPNLYRISLGIVNAYILVEGEKLILIDTGSPGGAARILKILPEAGFRADQLQAILLTHCHVDHTGGLAELLRLTTAQAWMHPLDAALVRQGCALRPHRPAPGLLNWLIYRLTMGALPDAIEPAEIAHEIEDGAVLPFGGLQAIHTPGHCAGHLAFLWPQHGGVLIAGDVASNMAGLGLSIIYEDLALGLRSLARLGELQYEGAVFGHGRPILRGASDLFRRKWVI